MSNGIDLSQIFSAVTGALQDNKASLNKADSYNQNHGDNMVQIFELITKATQVVQRFLPLIRLRPHRFSVLEAYAEVFDQRAAVIQGQ